MTKPCKSARLEKATTGNVRSLEGYQLNTDPTGSKPTPADGFLTRHPLLRVDTRSLAAAEVAEIALDRLNQEAEDTANRQTPLERQTSTTETIGSLYSRTLQSSSADD